MESRLTPDSPSIRGAEQQLRRQFTFACRFLLSFYGHYLQSSRSNREVNFQLWITPACFQVGGISKSLERILFIDITNFKDRDLRLGGPIFREIPR